MPADFNRIEVDISKLRAYCLSEEHLRGRHKARVFRSRLGLTARDALFLRQALMAAALRHGKEITQTMSDEYGRRYVLDFSLTTDRGRATVRSSWIVRTGEDVLRFVTCYVL